MSEVSSLLRAEGRYAVRGKDVPWRHLALILGSAGLLYGAVMGSFDLRTEQALYSALKVPLLLALTSLVCLPNFFVVNSVLGLRDDFAAACRGIFTAQAAVAVTLAALAPITALGYVSGASYRFALLLNGTQFAFATVAGQMLLSRHYRPLIAANPRHWLGWLAWVVLYVFVAIQMAWVLRPFIGWSGIEPSFLREDLWSNAYVEVARALWRLVAR